MPLKKMFPVLSPAPSASLQHCLKKSLQNQPSVSCLEFVSSILTVFGYRRPILDLIHALIPSLFYVMFWHVPAKILLPTGTLGHFCAKRWSSVPLCHSSTPLLHYYYSIYFPDGKRNSLCSAPVVPYTPFSLIPTISLVLRSCYGLGQRERHWLKMI